MPNLNAALGCAQLLNLDYFVSCKRHLAQHYDDFFKGTPFAFIKEPEHCRSNYWLNAVVCEDRSTRDALLKSTHQANIMTRPLWQPMHKLPMFANCLSDNLGNTDWFADSVVTLPSSVNDVFD